MDSDDRGGFTEKVATEVGLDGWIEKSRENVSCG